MPLLSFSVKKAELFNFTKTNTTRRFTEHRWTELVNAEDSGRPLYIWWKSRAKEKQKLYDATIQGLWVIGFIEGADGIWPWWGEVPDTTADVPLFLGERPMTGEEVFEYVAREGFETLTEFINVLKGKDGEILGEPMIRIQFEAI